MSEKRHHHRKSLRDNSRKLRREMTVPERLIWSRVRAKRLSNLKFRRQVPIGNYVVDFLCEDLHLILEIDGRSHDQQIEYDKERSEFLKSEGYQIVRYSNDDVIEDLDSVLEDILRHAEKLRNL